ncbi:hypothetical protein FNH22_02980 [Fulvivirga sp. M361]|uniref:hypothetical protein n=1 Tax=Fulvivirga sp. M361 TaxID=2594266 RepID=UPI00117AE552|nr:hypothetical protein [Fulvivirga sp. M361]TRX61758.1 hypothetical protein FNH22_02980 [Fulvivirga sp. M361]
MKTLDDILREKVTSLDSMPELSWNEDDLWQTLQSELGYQNLKKSRGRTMLWSSIAAAVSIVTVVFIKVFIADPGATITYTHYVEDAETAMLDENEAGSDEGARELIESMCLSDLEICKTPEFIELKDQLDEVAEEIESLDQMIAMYGEDPALARSKTEIENFKSEIMYQLIQIITS